MINRGKVLALIPARGGSKGIPKKNLSVVCGKTLLEHAITVAYQSKYIDKVVVSTDDLEISQVTKKTNAQVCLRPDKLSTDVSLVIDTIRYTIDCLQKSGDIFDICVLLEVTSPLRTVTLVDQCLAVFGEDPDVDSVATFSEAPVSPNRLWKIENGKASIYIEGAVPWLPRQFLPKAYMLNGLCYAFKIKSLIEKYPDSATTLFGKMQSIVTPSEMSIDVDTTIDLSLVDLIMRRNKNK